MFRKEDIAQIEQRGSSVQTVEEQVERFKKGFPWMKIVAPATPEKGIQVLDEAAVGAAVKYYEGASINGKCKFVPASGAASRMFKDLFSGLDALKDGKELADDAPAAKFVDKIAEFAFYTPELFGLDLFQLRIYRFPHSRFDPWRRQGQLYGRVLYHQLPPFDVDVGHHHSRTPQRRYQNDTQESIGELRHDSRGTRPAPLFFKAALLDTRRS